MLLIENINKAYIIESTYHNKKQKCLANYYQSNFI